MLKYLRERMRGKRPTPALFVAFIALLLALGGTAGALRGKNKIDKNDLRANVVKSKHIAKNQVKGVDALESSFAEVPKADNGVQGYALIENNATVNGNVPSLNITSANVSSGGVGEYCFEGLPFTPRGIQVTGDAISGEGPRDNFFVGSVAPGGACAGTEQASVESRDDNDAADDVHQNADFYVVFF